ncbi:MAG: carboxymuconolactone decarboxylase family protein [Corynebacterium sp.]|uniref:carboxymuconolactone decarboxylase family protein n=1 Tax=unclassified Corynebacterium TaxID=2624378 RepID=UPI0026493FE1|nr:carboxymuconolactone decarboxylase family protein [Corynebacterium sp.]MDN5581359.1 carboxymuconolactone decarboxylase family protein [Corynebacterium sp.]MDN5718633.1 carboxymuconolactone decarboxylase family protein [Corynebacterium sp.]MDN6323944.1 carboxymuconolactone decarboxylase family protein [Corynebacterium sp.]
MTHIDLMKIRKRTYAAAGAFELAARSGLDRRTRLLVELRASFLNNCSYCIGMHSDEALKHDFGQAWVDAIRDWTPDATGTPFSASDALVLAFTTAGTRLSEDADFDVDLQERVLAEFGEKTTGALISEIAAINMWNRLGVLSQK